MFNETFPLQVYINLDSRVDRLSLAKKEFANIGINPIRKNGFVPTHIEDTFARGTVGCYVSHYQILLAALHLDTNVFIFEDDILFTQHPAISKKVMDEACEQLPENWEIFYLGGNILFPFDQISESLAKLRHCQSTVAYGVNKNFLHKLLEYLNPEKNGITKPIDVMYSDLSAKNNFYITVPMLAIQRDSFSDIEGQNVNYSSYLQRRYDENFRPMK